MSAKQRCVHRSKTCCQTQKEFSECCLSFDGNIVTNASFVKNLGIFFDRTLCMQKQASAITKPATFKFATSNVIDRTPPKMRAKH